MRLRPALQLQRLASLVKRKLLAWRRRWNLSQIQAATALRVTKRTIENWEQGTRAPRGLARDALLAKLQHPPP